MSRPSHISPFLRAVAIILLAIFLFDVMGAIIKYLGGRYPVQQLSAFRNLFGLIPSVLVLWFSREWHGAGRPLVIRQWKLGLLRGGFVTIAQFCFYLSLIKLEFATASTIAFAGPLFVTSLSVLVLKHRVGLWRWSAVAVGFIGIMLVMRPGSEIFTWYALLPLGASFCYACTSVTVRLMDEAVPSATINLYSHVGSLTGASLLVIATDAYVPIESVHDWLWIIAMGLVGGMAVLCLIIAYRLTQPSNLSPFEYFGIPFSFTIGWLVFAEAPFGRLFPGVVLIVAGGLMIVWRERVAQKARTAGNA